MTEHATLQVQLEERLQELIARATEIDQSLSELGDDDWDENAIESAGDEVLERVGQATIDEIRRIQQALAAIKTGTYGTCSECGVKISAERLEALPEATKCQRCSS